MLDTTMLDICLFILNHTCQACGFHWTTSSLVLRVGINAYTEIDCPPEYAKALSLGAKITCYSIRDLRAPICHRCTDPHNLILGWPPYKENKLTSQSKGTPDAKISNNSLDAHSLDALLGPRTAPTPTSTEDN